MKMEQSVPKRLHIKFRRRGITQKKAYNQNTAKVWNKEDGSKNLPKMAHSSCWPNFVAFQTAILQQLYNKTCKGTTKVWRRPGVVTGSTS